jgi:hypothetical protein
MAVKITIFWDVMLCGMTEIISTVGWNMLPPSSELNSEL